MNPRTLFTSAKYLARRTASHLSTNIRTPATHFVTSAASRSIRSVATRTVPTSDHKTIPVICAQEKKRSSARQAFHSTTSLLIAPLLLQASTETEEEKKKKNDDEKMIANEIITSDLSSLKPGDIVFFLPNGKPAKLFDTIVQFGQSMVTDAHPAITHVGIIIETHPKIKVADVNIQNGFNIRELNPNRSYLVFRPASEEVRNRIVSTVNTVKDSKHQPSYSKMSLIATNLSGILQSPRPSVESDSYNADLSRSTNCSQFVADVVMNAIANQPNEIKSLYRPNKMRFSVAELELEFRKNPDAYTMFGISHNPDQVARWCGDINLFRREYKSNTQNNSLLNSEANCAIRPCK